MPSVYPKVLLKDCLDFFNGKSIKAADEGLYPVYGSNGRIGFTDEHKYVNAIILGRVGAYCGSVEYCSDRFWASDNTIVVKPKANVAEVRYLSYLLRDLNLNQHAGGAAQPLLTQATLKQVEAPLPPLPTQRKISSILSAYDDLIENNTRRIAILEEMAQAIYREWFVHFRFPGHQNGKLVDSILGPIPEGWRVVTLKDVCIEKKGIQTGPFGSQLHRYDYTDDGTPVVMPKDISQSRVSTDSIARVPAEVCDRLPRHRLEVGDTVCARRGEIGRNAFVTDRELHWMCGTGCMRIRPESSVISPRFLFDYLCTPNIVSLIAGKAAGAIMPNLNIGIMESVPILLPRKAVQLSYEELAMTNLEVVSNLVSKNDNLRATRDLLLPKLISGKLDVEDLDIDVGMTAQEPAVATAIPEPRPSTSKQPATTDNEKTIPTPVEAPQPTSIEAPQPAPIDELETGHSLIR